MSISTNAIGKFETCHVADFAGNDFSNHDKFAFTVNPPDDTVTSSVSETANDGSPPNTDLDAFFSLPFVFADGSDPMRGSSTFQGISLLPTLARLFSIRLL